MLKKLSTDFTTAMTLDLRSAYLTLIVSNNQRIKREQNSVRYSFESVRGYIFQTSNTYVINIFYRLFNNQKDYITLALLKFFWFGEYMYISCFDYKYLDDNQKQQIIINSQVFIVFRI